MYSFGKIVKIKIFSNVLLFAELYMSSKSLVDHLKIAYLTNIFGMPSKILP